MDALRYISNMQAEITHSLREGVHDAIAKIVELPEDSTAQQMYKTSAYVELLASILSFNEEIDKLSKTVLKSLEHRRVFQG